MSKTQFKNAERVWRGFLGALFTGGGGEGVSVRTSEISKMCGLSKPTCQRYMLMAREEGRVSLRIVNGTGYWRREG